MPPFERVTLQGDYVRLEPLSVSHSWPLVDAISDA